MASVTLRAGVFVALLLLLSTPVAVAAPEGQLTWGVHTSLVPRGSIPPRRCIVTPFMVLLRAARCAGEAACRARRVAPSLAESWSRRTDGLVYEFVLRKGVKFHNGEPVTAEDVEVLVRALPRRRDANTLKEHVAAVEIAGPRAGALPPQAAVARLHDLLRDASPPAPAGSCRRSMSRRSATTGSRSARRRRALPLRLVHAGHRAGAGGQRGVLAQAAGREAPASSRSIPDQSTRLVALKRGEVDIVYLHARRAGRGRAPDARPRAEATSSPRTHWLSFPDQWDPKSPWHDRRVRLAANHAIDRPAIDQAEHPRASRSHLEHHAEHHRFLLAAAALRYDPARAERLLAEAGYPERLRRRRFHCDATRADAPRR